MSIHSESLHVLYACLLYAHFNMSFSLSVKVFIHSQPYNALGNTTDLCKRVQRFLQKYPAINQTEMCTLKFVCCIVNVYIFA